MLRKSLQEKFKLSWSGTSGGTFIFGIKENNYLGKGLAVDANFSVSAETFKGILGVENLI